jgi:SpoVK/Ycf46/Vps4 family AAA+-type ATPase
MTLNNRIVIMTTNHMEALDPALYRRQRVTRICTFEHVTHANLATFISRFWTPPTPEQLAFIKEGVYSHALLWDVKEMFTPATTEEFLKHLEQECAKEG